MNLKVWIITLIATTFSMGSISAYSMIKDPISREFNFDEEFLGLMDGLVYLIRIINGIFFILYPMKKLVLGYTIMSVGEILFLCLIPAAKIIGHEKLILVIANIGIGMCKNALIFPTFILNYYVNPAQDMCMLSTYAGLFYIGNTIAVLLMDACMNSFQIDWSYSLMIYCCLFLGSILLHQFTISEIQAANDEENMSEKASRMFYQTKQYLKKCSNFLFVIQFAFIEGYTFVVLLWYPFYFIQLGFSSVASLFSIFMPTLLAISPISEFCLVFSHSTNTIILSILLIVNLILVSCLSLLGSQSEDIPIYIILLFFSGLSYGINYLRSSFTDVSYRALGNMQELYIVLFLIRIVRNAVVIVFLYLTGYLMKINLKSFMYLNVLITVIFTVASIIRKILDHNDKKIIEYYEAQRNEDDDFED